MKQKDKIIQRRRELPMVKVKPYTLQSEHGQVSLVDLFKGNTQLIIYVGRLRTFLRCSVSVKHAMYEPEDDQACKSCSLIIDAVPPVEHFLARDTAFALVSRAPLEKLLKYRKRMGWDSLGE